MKVLDPAQLTTLTGEFLGYELKDGYKIKRLQLLTASGIQSIKLSKQAKACLFRISLETPLTPGQSLSLQVKANPDPDTTEIKAYEVLLTAGTTLSASSLPPLPTAVCSALNSRVSSTTIKVCDRGTCRKRGSQQVIAALNQEVCDRNLSPQIQVQPTGCLKACKHGVNVKVNGVCHQQVSPAQVAAIIPAIESQIQNPQNLPICYNNA